MTPIRCAASKCGWLQVCGKLCEVYVIFINPQEVMEVTIPHSLVWHRALLIFCLVLAELDLFLKVILLAAAAVCEQKTFVI